MLHKAVATPTALAGASGWNLDCARWRVGLEFGPPSLARRVGIRIGVEQGAYGRRNPDSRRVC